MAARITNGSRLEFNSFRHKLRNGKHYVGSGSGYIEIGDDGWAALKLLKRGRTIAQAERSLAKKFGKCDLVSFGRTLASNGFVKSVGGKKLAAPNPGMMEFTLTPGVLVKTLAWLLFSRVAYLAYAVMLVLAMAIVRSNPGYILGHGDFIFTDSLALFLPLSFAITWLLVLLHEFSHYLAGVSLGARPKFGLTHRMFYLVAVTELDSLHELEPRFRDRAYLAGMVADLLVISWAIIVMDSNPLGIFAAGSMLFKLLRFVVLVEVLGLIWQFLFFLRTDLYYYFANMLEIENLHPRGMSLLGSLWHSLRTLSVPHEQWFRSALSQKPVVFYALAFVFGFALNTAIFMLFEFPITIELFTRAFSGLFTGLASGNLALLADSIVFLLISGFNFALLGTAIVASGSHKKGIAHLLHYGKVMLQPIHAVMKLSGK